MRFHWLLLILVLFFFCCAPKKQSKQSGSLSKENPQIVSTTYIEWNENRKLTWGDFQGISVVNDTIIAAVTSCGFGYNTNLVFPFSTPKFTVRNLFYPLQSWIKDSEKFRPDLLEHEQLHFDIAEVYARRLRMELKASQANYFNFRKKSEQIFDKIHSAYLEKQEAYEQESAYSLNTKMQNLWKKRIEDELDSLKTFSK